MSELTTNQFGDFFRAIHGHLPFPWQSMLLERVVAAGDAGGWPDLIDLPTASGKTACIDVAVFALALGVPTPRRVWFVVDRRIVVDEAFARAEKIANGLRSAASDSAVLREVAGRLLAMGTSRTTPLAVGRLRGGVPRDIGWAGNPAQPAVLTSTIDQLGSRLLFRGYGVGQHAQPIHAALTGNDSLIVLDEAHLAGPFLQTVGAVAKFRGEPWTAERLSTPFKLVVMSATPPEGMESPVRFPHRDERSAALDHPLLHKRISVLKRTELSEARVPKAGKGKPDVGPALCDDELVLDAAARALAFKEAGRRRIAVMVNRVATARNIARQLRSSDADAEVELLTGRLRPLDRDVLVGRLSPLLRSGTDLVPEKPIILVTTQCLEVGADFSFDALVTECASLDALRQRFGRLARLGDPADAEGVILIRKSDARPDGKLDDDDPMDPIYGNAAARTWNWLTAGGAKSIDMGIAALEPRLAELDTPEKLQALLGPKRFAPTMLPAYLDLWCQTSPRPAAEPDTALFLHGVPPPGERPRAEARVLWRRDLVLAKSAEWRQLVANLRPLTGEMLQVPLKELRDLLAGGAFSLAAADADLEGLTEPEERAGQQSSPASAGPAVSFVIWRGRDDCLVTSDARELRPNDVVVLPAADDDGSNPEALAKSFTKLLPAATLPPDVYEPAYRLKHGVIRRLWRTVTDRFGLPGDFDPDAVLEELRLTISENDRINFFDKPRPDEYGPGFYHFTGRLSDEPLDVWESDDDEDESLYTGKPLSLADHTRQVKNGAAALGGLLPDYTSVILRAAELHDVGKADERFQYILRHGKDARASEGLLGKSPYRLPRDKERKLYDLSRLPDGFRHELLSMQMVALLPPDNGHDPDLLLHLIGAHHGQCRPSARVIDDSSPPLVTCPVDGGAPLSISEERRRADPPPHRLDSDVAERFWRLTRRFGWWGLAYLEAMLRCADTHASKFAEQEAKQR